MKDFPGKAFPLVILWFAILVGGAATFSVLHAKDEDKAKAAEFEKAGKESKPRATTTPPVRLTTPGEGQAEGGGRRRVRAQSPRRLGPRRNGSARRRRDRPCLRHDQPEQQTGQGHDRLHQPLCRSNTTSRSNTNGKQLADSELIAERRQTSASAELAPGTYTFYCTVPGHREAGMEGTLTVK